MQKILFVKAKNYIYDIETYPNFFCVVFNSGGKEIVFEISGRKNDYDKLLKFYKPSNICYAIGFNNVSFDAQVLEWLLSTRVSVEFKKLQGSELTKKIFEYAQHVIEIANNPQGGFLPISEWKMVVPQIDLFLQNHYKNKARQTSLKWLEFAMNHDVVQDLPYKFNVDVSPKHFDEVIEYCKNDVRATRCFAEKSRDLMKLRISQSTQYPDLRLLNKPDPSVGETLFLHFMSEAMGIDKKELKSMRTHRGRIPISEILLPYINFKTPEFQSVLDFYKTAVSGGLQKMLKYRGIDVYFGEGGLHASWEDRIFETDDEYVVVDYDVTSFYPNLAIVNGWRPEHLGDAFNKVYKNIFEERKKYKKGTPENQSYKIILNGSYGKFGDEHSFLYDPKIMLQICVNGQLLLAMLAERFSLVEGCTIVQCNTDGVTIHIPKKNLPQIEDIAKRWEKLTKLELEKAVYKKMIISNVNNYIAQYDNGKIKDKGLLYVVDSEFHKNPSQRIVRIALRRYFVYGIPIRETIENHLSRKEDYEDGIKNNGIYDFCLGRKVKWNQSFVLIKGVEENRINQKVIRYYITNEKATMMKKYNDGRIEAVNKGYNAKLFMNYEDLDDYDINYDFYINEAYKVTTPFDGGNPKVGKQLCFDF